MMDSEYHFHMAIKLTCSPVTGFLLPTFWAILVLSLLLFFWSLLCLFSYQEMNGYHTAEALSDWEALSLSGCDCSTKQEQTVVKVLQVCWFLPRLLLVNLHLPREQTERNSFWIVSTANIYFFLFTYEDGKFFAFIISTLKKIIVQYSSIEPVQWAPRVLLGRQICGKIGKYLQTIIASLKT